MSKALVITDLELLKISEIFCEDYAEVLIKVIEDHGLENNLTSYLESETHMHTEGVRRNAMLIAKYMGLDKSDKCKLCRIAPLHDFGKLSTPGEVLNKPGSLDKEEFEIMKQHSHEGYLMLSSLQSKFFKLAAMVANEHHEKWNGKGYPSGLKGEEINLLSRIVAAADVLDALLRKRVYKPAWEPERVYKLFEEESGKQFDPKVASVVLEHFEEFVKIYHDTNCFCNLNVNEFCIAEEGESSCKKS
jgi:HD-GYP domain-containing protein (c-di-GMP phosphodiesterase class II)